MMNQKTQDYRQKIADSFLQVLKEKDLHWKKQWQSEFSQLPINAISNTKYKGINLFWLYMKMQENEWSDPRFATFKQISDKNWHLKKGSKGLNVEYWMPYDFEKKKALSWEDYKKLTPNEKENIGLTVKYFTVFHATCIEGLPALPERITKDISVDEAVKKIQKNMNISILNDGNDRAFYRPSEDKIHLPKPEYFDSEYSYNATALHELAHATGAAHRLNRDLSGRFGSNNYAYEELIAEISSCFTSINIKAEQSEFEIQNHKAYIKNWIRDIEENPNVLIKAIKEADKVANYLEYKAELITEKEYQKDAKLNATSEEQEITTEKTEYNISPRRYVMDENKNLERTFLKLYIENDLILNKGSLSEKLKKTLDDEGYTWKDGVVSKKEANISTNIEIENDLKKVGFKPTKTIVGNIKRLQINCSEIKNINDIYDYYSGKKIIDGAENQSIAKEIIKECRNQELNKVCENDR